MSTNRRALERAAIAAHRDGMTWRDFWPTVASDVAAAEPWDRDAYRRIVRRLSHLLTCGDMDRMEPAGDGWPRPCPWELDDLASKAVASDWSPDAVQGPMTPPEPGAWQGGAKLKAER